MLVFQFCDEVLHIIIVLFDSKDTNYCSKTEILFYCPSYEDIKLIAKAIKEEKWEIN